MAEYQEDARWNHTLTYDHAGAIGPWTVIEPPAPLFRKLSEGLIDEE
jgi:hypothetical protein